MNQSFWSPKHAVNADKFWSWAEPIPFHPCLEWTGFRAPNGRPQYTSGVRAHRVSYFLSKGPIPSGMHVLHTCDNIGCIRPEHLYLGTHQDNMRDRSLRRRVFNATKTRCKYGHSFSDYNLIVKPSGERQCRLCKNRLQRLARLRSSCQK